MKAVLITESNQAYLSSRYGVDAEAFPIGYIMIAVWGDNGQFRYQGTMLPADFDELFSRGQTLANDFFEAIEK